jgi:hypothetical protein
VSKYSVDDNVLAEKLFQQAVDLDPRFAGSYKGLALTQSQARDLRVAVYPRIRPWC